MNWTTLLLAMSNKRPRAATEVFKIVHGTFKLSKYATSSILVPEDDADRVHKALSTSKKQLHDWIIADEVFKADDIQTRFLEPTTTLPETFHDAGRTLTEEEVLNIIHTGDSVPLKKYVVCFFQRKHFCYDHKTNVFEESGVVCIECDDGSKECDEAIKCLKEICKRSTLRFPHSFSDYSYVLRAVKVWGESEMTAKKHMLKVRHYMKMTDDWFKELKEKYGKEVTTGEGKEVDESEEEEDHIKMYNIWNWEESTEGETRVLNWLLDDGVNSAYM